MHGIFAIVPSMVDPIPTWISQLATGTVAEQAEAAESLARLGTDAQPAAVALVHACGTDEESLCAWCSEALENLGPPAADQISSLIELAQNPSSNSAYWAITLLGRAKEEADGAVLPLANLLISDSPEVATRERAAWALRQIGPTAHAALPALQEVASSNNGRLARLAQQAMDAIRG